MNAKRPLLTAVENYRLQHVYPLHTPGHKGGRGADPVLRHLVGDVALESDVSLMAELDDIHHPEGCIRDTETLAARLYGADRCFLGVNGTTGVIHGMLLGALKPGEKILIPGTATGVYWEPWCWADSIRYISSRPMIPSGD